jgi:hypothetical protein
MAVSGTVKKRLALSTGLRALLMLLFGIYASSGRRALFRRWWWPAVSSC